ncbi:MAG: hypothetical protein K9J37_19670 [Saprospiraceae bacterium]|nr:hypothetical protein [Saprospiraceae bacterium]MCF8252145.1 hypothetical protein [Saprospiraceae bacterium]MCF8282446.1 hypothetical protein [Bacteroidales bacterium]MCF8313814.1 hypothetical protein [Saprospiraceae bacterium]MCF8442520.1 hypothetical protein [Saprospiraceae bacterium]
MQAALQKGEKDYLLLFEEMDALVNKEDGDSKYDEVKLRTRLKGKVGSNQFHVLKNYLLGLIMKSLRSLSEKNDYEEQITTLLSDARILEQKGVYDLSFKKLESLKALCLKYEKYTFVIEACSMEATLLARTAINEAEEKLGALKNAIDRFSNLLFNINSYNDLKHRVLALYRQENRARNEATKAKLDAMLEEELMQNENLPATFHSKVAFYHSWALASLMQSELEKAKHYYKCLLEIWAGYPHFKEAHPSLYIIYSSNYLVCCHAVQDYAPFEELLNELKSLPVHTVYEEAEAFQNIYFLEQLQFMNSIMLSPLLSVASKAKTLSNEIEVGLKRHGNKVVKSRELSLLHNTVVMFFALGDFNEVLHWVTKIHQALAGSDQRKEIQLFAKLIQLVIYMEKGEHLYIDTAFKSFEYHLRKEDKMHDFEGRVTFYLKLIATKKQDKKTALQDFKEELSQFSAQKLPGYEEICIWVESKIKNVSFLEVMRERSRAF